MHVGLKLVDLELECKDIPSDIYERFLHKKQRWDRTGKNNTVLCAVETAQGHRIT